MATFHNVFNCSHLPLKSLSVVPELTQTMLLSHTDLEEITEELVQQMKNLSTLKFVDFRNSSIKKIDKSLQHLNSLEEFWLGGNPFHCDCSMKWMISWLNTFKNNSKFSIVEDIDEIKCGNIKFQGLPIHLLSDVLLGCYPSRWTTGQKAGVSAAAVVAIVLFCLTVFAFKHSREVKFFMYYYLKLDTVPKDNKNENLEGAEFDAFLCYW